MFLLNIWHRSTFVSPRPTAILTDRNGVFMAQLGGGPAGYGYWPVDPVPSRVAAAILALEDRRFWDHPGVDPIAVLRALRTDAAAGRRVSGASTLAMQVARMQHPEARNPASKFMEAATALVMTARYGRAGVLQQYLRLAPFGQDGHGIAYAAQWYFARPVADLSWAQIALLSAIPQSPGAYNLNAPSGLRRAKSRAVLALARLHARNVIDAPTYAEALTDLALLTPRSYPARDPDALHAILQIQALTPPAEQLRATIDLGLERNVTQIARARLAQLAGQGAQQVAVIVADRASMGVLALVGSAQYGAANNGEIDYAMRWRSPGSTLKPFIYAQALARGAIAPDSLLADSPYSGTGMQDADRRFLGDLLAPQALANSRNVPAAELVRLDGLDASESYLAALGLNDRVGADYGLSLAIGGMPTELTRLVTAYGAFANDGVLQPLQWYDGEPELAAPVMPLGVARMVTLFLSDPMARLPSFTRMGSMEFPFPVAVKTGTSQGYRDAWVVEFTDRYVIGVWVGRPDGQPMDGVTGAQSAALIGQDVLTRLYGPENDGQDDTGFAPPPGTRPVEICATTGAPADGSCARQMLEYLPGGVAAPAAPAVAALRITAPLDHSVYIMNPDTPPGLAVLPLQVSGAGAVEWLVDGREYGLAPAGQALQWPAIRGRHIFEAQTPDGTARSRPVEVLVQ